MAGTVDVFELIARGEEPPAPLLCAAVLHSKQEYGPAAALYVKLLSKVDGKPLPLSSEDLVLKADLLGSLAQLAAAQGNPAAALELYERALQLHERPRPPTPPPPAAPDSDDDGELFGGADSPPAPQAAAAPTEPLSPCIEQPAEAKQLAMASLQSGCAGCLESLGRRADAASQWTLALAAYGACGQGHTAEAGDALFSLAALKAQLGLGAEAKPLLARCVAVETKLFGAGHVRTDQARRALDELQAPLRWASPDPNAPTFTVEQAVKQAES